MLNQKNYCRYCEKQQIVRLTSENLCNVNNQNCVDVVQSDEFYLICLYRSLNLLGKVESYDETVYTPLTDMCSGKFYVCCLII